MAFLLPALAPAAELDLLRLLKAVEDHYNRPRTIQVLFEQTYRVRGRAPRTESGELFLRRPGRMRWQYRVPPGKLFLSDGKHIYFYSPTANRVEKTPVKESDDLRAPLAFLIGRLDFHRDFREFRTRPEAAGTRTVAMPKSDRAPYQQVEFLITPLFQIRRLLVTGHDQSVMEFAFDQERLNPAIEERLFQFQMPPGAELVEVGATADERR